MSDIPTCPLSDEELVIAALSDHIEDATPAVYRRDVALAVVAAERARLREAITDSYGENDLVRVFDAACQHVDATTRRADT